MPRSSSVAINMRTILISLCAFVIILSGAPLASAQLGGGLGGGGGKSGSGGSSGSSSRSREKPPRPKRHEQPAIDSNESRAKLHKALELAFTRGTTSTPFLMNLFDQASTSAQPASSQSRKALAESLSIFKGQKLASEQAAMLSLPIAAAVNADGVAPEDWESTRESLKSALNGAGMNDQQLEETMSAVDRVVSDQQDEAIKELIEKLDALQQEGAASDDQKRALAESLTALAPSESAPDEALISKLADDLGKALDEAQLTRKEKAQLAFNLRTAVNSAAMTVPEFHQLLNEVRTILKAGLVKQAGILAVANDLMSLHKSVNGGQPAAVRN